MWSEADRKRTPFYLEADTLLLSLAKCRFWALSSPFPLYAFSDHLPLKWVRKCEKGPVSEFTIEQLSDLSWIHSYLPGPENSLFDALSRYPLLGPRVLAPVGLSDAVSTLLDHLPVSLMPGSPVSLPLPTLKRSRNNCKHGATPQIRLISTPSRTSTPPAPNTDFVLTMPRAEDAPRIAARLLTTIIPFAILLPADLAPRIADANQFPDQPDLQAAYKQAGKIMFLDSDHLWFLGNIPSLSNFFKIFSHVLDRPSPLLSHYAGTLPTPVPTTLDEWKQAQLSEPDFLTPLDPNSLANCNGLTVFKSARLSVSYSRPAFHPRHSRLATPPRSTTRLPPQSSHLFGASLFLACHEGRCAARRRRLRNLRERKRQKELSPRSILFQHHHQTSLPLLHGFSGPRSRFYRRNRGHGHH